MRKSGQPPRRIIGISLRSTPSALALATLFVLAAAGSHSAQAQTFNVIHTFTGGDDGYQPTGTLTLDRAGNLYGTTTDLGGPGTVFQLKRSNGSWILNTLYTFLNSTDGFLPFGGVVFGPNGTLYGTTYEGGTGSGGGQCQQGCGTVFNLTPPARACRTALCGWTESAIYSFQGGSDGIDPNASLVFDQAGALYGTTPRGGLAGEGIVFQLTLHSGEWTENILHTFTGIGSDGSYPATGMIFDSAGNLYGTTVDGGSFSAGTVFQLAPSGSGWTTSTVHDFDGGNGGAGPLGALTFDGSGKFYGTTSGGGLDDSGTVFELTFSGGTWSFAVLYSVPAGSDNSGPQGNLAMDAAGNLYGATYDAGAHHDGNVFKLTPINGGWTYTSLHDFTGGADGANPLSGVTLDSNGNLYGTTTLGGMQGGNNCNTLGCGVVWEITP